MEVSNKIAQIHRQLEATEKVLATTRKALNEVGGSVEEEKSTPTFDSSDTVFRSIYERGAAVGRPSREAGRKAAIALAATGDAAVKRGRPAG